MSLRFSINEKCTSCMACVRVCPVEAIAVSGNQLRIDPTACIECGLCKERCPYELDVPALLKRQLAEYVELAGLEV